MAGTVIREASGSELPVLRCALTLPMNGAWSAEVEVAADAALSGAVRLTLPGGPTWNGLVVRSEHSAERARARIIGGTVTWTTPTVLQHYRSTTTGAVLAGLGVSLDAPSTAALPFWTRKASTIGEGVSAIATHLGVNWRVNPDGTLRIRAEAPEQVDPDAVEVLRDATRGIVELAPEAATLLPGVLRASDSVGDVIYDVSEDSPLRCRYYTAARAVLRGSLERLIRGTMRDVLYLGQYTAVVQRQAADGTLDLLPDDARIRGNGLQGVPIRHGLPGVEVEVPAGVRVLLGFDNGDSRSPYAALWHSGQVTSVRIGGESAVALAELVSARLDRIQAAFDSHVHATAGLGAPSPPIPNPATIPPIAPPVVPVGPLEPVASQVLRTS